MTGKHGNLQKHLNPNPLQKWLLARFHAKIAALIRSTGARSVLDVGCGEGFTMRELREESVLAGVKALGLDFNAVALRWNWQNGMSQTPLFQADIHHLPFASASFDLVYSLEVLEHLPDSAVGLRELKRVSKDYVLLSVPHEPLFRGMNFLRGKHIAAWGNDPEHLHNYSGRAFARLVSAALTIITHIYSLPWQIVLAKKA